MNTEAIDKLIDKWEGDDMPAKLRDISYAMFELRQDLQTLIPDTKTGTEPDPNQCVLSDEDREAGWKEWHGGEQPVADGVLVYVRYPGGGESWEYSETYQWDYYGLGYYNRIIAYRIVRPEVGTYVWLSEGDARCIGEACEEGICWVQTDKLHVACISWTYFDIQVANGTLKWEPVEEPKEDSE